MHQMKAHDVRYHTSGGTLRSWTTTTTVTKHATTSLPCNQITVSRVGFKQAHWVQWCSSRADIPRSREESFPTCHREVLIDWSIDDRLYSAIFRSPEQTHCARMWWYILCTGHGCRYEFQIGDLATTGPDSCRSSYWKFWYNYAHVFQMNNFTAWNCVNTHVCKQ